MNLFELSVITINDTLMNLHNLINHLNLMNEFVSCHFININDEIFQRT